MSQTQLQRRLPPFKDLAGKSVLVRKGSSYVGHLQALSQQLIAEGYPAIQIDEADPRLSTEDILEMVDAGAVQVTVADEHLATMWSAMLSELRIESELLVNSGGKIAWATRPNSPKLINSLNAFIKENRKGSLIGNILFSRYYKNNRWITNPLSDQDRERLLTMRRLFETYGAQYGINWLELVAQGYQESGLISPSEARPALLALCSFCRARPLTAASGSTILMILKTISMPEPNIWRIC